MKDKISQYKQGVTIPLQYVDITYAGFVPGALAGLSFYFTIEDYEAPNTERISLTEADMNLDDNGGDPIVSFDIDTATLTAEVLYDVEFTVVDPAYGEHVLDEFYLWLRPRVKDIP